MTLGAIHSAVGRVRKTYGELAACLAAGATFTFGLGWGSIAQAQSLSTTLPSVTIDSGPETRPARSSARPETNRAATRNRDQSDQGTPGESAEVVVTPDRQPEAIDRSGSAISVVSRQTLATTNPGSLVDALRTVPGLDVTESGGPGATTNVRLRGANPGQTLVLIDGVRVNDPAAASGDFDFATLAPGLVDHIEVLKGPQSALYGSDAMGGVINIITRKGGGAPRASLQAEGGTYGTASTNGALTGSSGPWSYAVSGGGQHSNGFSRYGYRIPDLEARYGPLERDGFDRVNGTARLGYDAGDDVRVEAGLLSSFTRSAYDRASGTLPDTPSNATRLLQQVWGRASADTLDGLLTHSLNVFETHTSRSFNDISYRTNTLPQNTTSTMTDYIGNSYGAEYQGNLKLGAFGSLIVGAKTQRETASTFGTNILPIPGPRTPQLSGAQDTNSGFALWQVPVGERLNLSFGGRIDDVVDVARFETWRTTASYAINETGTRFHASAGTGAKAPTLYQLYAPLYGNTALRPEESFGYDAGVDQSLIGGRVTVSVTAFSNRFSNLIDFVVDRANPNGHYVNVSRAATKGVELAAMFDVVPGFLKITAAYTYLDAKDLSTGLTLSRRPEHVGRLAFTFTPTDRWIVEPRLLAVSKRFSSSDERLPLDSYQRLDLYTSYKVDHVWTAYLRGENILNTRYQEVANYGTTGPAIYAGFNATW